MTPRSTNSQSSVSHSLLALFLLVLTGAVFAGLLASSPAHAQLKTGKSGLPLPRFVSLKSAKANMRVGPGKEYKVAWSYKKSGYPLEIIEEYDNWRKVRDPEGTEGWVFHSLLSGRRTAIVSPWNRHNPQRKVNLLARADANSSANAVLEPGVVVRVYSCEESWCNVSASGADQSHYKGYIEQNKLWGVYPDETIDD